MMTSSHTIISKL